MRGLRVGSRRERQWLFRNIIVKEGQCKTGHAEEEPVTWVLQWILNVLEFSNQAELTSLEISLS